MKESNLEYTKNPNVVANMSSQEYFRRKSLEIGLENFPEVEFIAIPTLHEGSDKAKEIIDITKNSGADILLIENFNAYSKGVKGFNEGVKKDKSKRALDFVQILDKDPNSFYNFLLSEVEKLGILCDTYEFKRETVSDVLDFIDKIQESYKMIFDLDIKSFYDAGDEQGALQKLNQVMFAKNGLEEVQTEREWLMLNNISPRVFELISKNKELLKKDKVKVSYFIGAGHQEGFIDKMLERGDPLKVIEVNDFNDFKLKRKYISLRFLLSLFLICFLRDLDEEDSERLSKFIQNNSNLRVLFIKNPQKVIDIIMKAKKQDSPAVYFTDEIPHEIV